MTRLLTLFLVFTSLTVSGQGDYLKYPDYELVITEFFDHYSIKDLPTNALIKFEKRPTGWHISVDDQTQSPSNLKYELFWSSEKGKFNKVNFPKVKDANENQRELEKFKVDRSGRYFKICPYYGYPGWDWDVIQELENVNNLPDSTLYAIGRAYSSFASNLLNNHSGLADTNRQFDLPEGKDCLTKEQLEQYRFFRHKAQERYGQLAERNPNFETIVGTIEQKRSNEFLVSFLDLRVYQNEEEANKELKDGLYNDFYLGYAKNLLMACSPNAILFTNGDNDTFPLLYVQSQLGFRTDVLIVNMSLLSTERYVNNIREGILDAAGFPLTFTAEEISGEKRQVILIERREKNHRDLSDLIEFVKDDSHVKTYSTIEYSFVPTNKYALPHGDEKVEWEVNQRYFLRNHLMLLDMLATNQWERPVYFSTGMSEQNFFGLTNYFQLEGVTYQLVSKKGEPDDKQIGTVNTAILYENLLNSFDWSGLKTLNSHEKLVCVAYRSSFHRLADALITENKLDSAEAVLDKCLDVMPNNVVSYDYVMLTIIEDYFKINGFEKGNDLALKLLHNLQNDIGNYTDLYIVKRSNHKEAAIQRLKELAYKYDQNELIDELEK